MVQGADQQNAAPQNFTIQIDTQLPSFTPTGSMQTARALHTVTLLSNGKVVVMGGQGNNGTAPLGSIEVFDPATGQFTPTAAQLMTPRSEHTATLLKGGKVLVTGGQDVNGNAIAQAELFDPNTDSVAPAGTMQSPRTGHTATLLNDGRVLVAGGLDSPNNSLKSPLSTAELFDPTTEQFTLATMAGSHAYHAAALLSSGKVLLTGGSSGPNLVYTEIFDPAVNTFASINAGTNFSFLTATLLVDGRVLLAGGEVPVRFVDCNSEEKVEVESTVFALLFDGSAASFSSTGHMSSSRALHTATLLPGGKVLMAGGLNISAVESGCVLSRNSVSLASAELFDPTQGTFALTTSMTTPRSRHTTTLLPNGGVLVIGGLDANNNPLASAELYH